MPRRTLLALVGFAGLIVQPPTRHGEEPLAHEWRLVEGKHWQVVAPAPLEDAAVADASEGTRGRCAPGMVEVQGRMVAGAARDLDVVDALQKSTCVSWLNRTFPERCERYDEDRWKALAADLPRSPMHFCIDRFEYPDRRGAYPWIMVDWNEARDLCAREGKRLCSEAEWTFACEGDDAAPYPYGYQRDPEACVIDRPWRPYDALALRPRDTDRARVELDHLWQGEASGTRPRCRSRAAASYLREIPARTSSA